MYIKTEPKGWNMHAVFLYFKEGDPDEEDEEVKRYLSEHKLIPKERTKTTVGDAECEVWYYGGCYLRNHFQEVAAIQRRVVTREMLAEEIQNLLRGGLEDGARKKASALDDGQLAAAVGELVDEYHQESSFGSDDDGNLKVTLDAAAVQESFLNLPMVGGQRSR